MYRKIGLFAGLSLSAVILTGCGGGGGGSTPELSYAPPPPVNATPAGGGASGGSTSGGGTTSGGTTGGGTTGGGTSSGSTSGQTGSGSSGGQPTNAVGYGSVASVVTWNERAAGPSAQVSVSAYDGTQTFDAETRTSSNKDALLVRVGQLERTFPACPPNYACMITPKQNFTNNSITEEDDIGYYKTYTYGMVANWNQIDFYSSPSYIKYDNLNALIVSGSRSASMPTSSTAYYNGDAWVNYVYGSSSPTIPKNVAATYIGDFSMRADFGSKTVSGRMDNFRLIRDSSPTHPLVGAIPSRNGTSLSLNGTIVGNMISYNVTGTADSLSKGTRSVRSSGAGYFYGPQAAEVGGAFTIKDSNGNVLGAAAFYGRR